MNLTARAKEALINIVIILMSLTFHNCERFPQGPYYELLLTERADYGNTFIHYLYVRGNYKKGYKDYQRVACEYYGAAKNKIPISGIIFVKSKEGTNRHKINTDFSKVRENTLFGFSYEYEQWEGVKEGIGCPILRNVWINVDDFKGVIKANNK